VWALRSRSWAKDAIHATVPSHAPRPSSSLPLGRRGRTSFLLDDAPTILIDGVRVPDFRALDDIDAQSILTIYIYDGIEGTTYYGTNSGSGVIVIQTKDGHT